MRLHCSISADKLSLELRMDGLSKVFGTMVSVLWILTTIYGFEYMTHEGHEDRFFAFFTMTFGVVLGIAFSGNFRPCTYSMNF